jgi:hypothetical protein
MMVSSFIWRLVAVLVLLVMSFGIAHAEGGELDVRAVSAYELAILKHPDLDRKPQKYPRIGVPRFGLHALYGLTHKINVGLGVEASLQRQTRTDDVLYQHTQDGDLTASYNDILLPVLVETSFANGSDWRWVAGIATGLALSRWQDTAMQLALDDGRQAFYKPTATWAAAWFGRLEMGRVWRPTDHFSMRVGASAGLKQQGDLHFGLWLSGSYLTGVGPQLDGPTWH